MRMVALFALVLLTRSFARSASFDCAKARTPQEKAICSSPQLSAADDQLAASYHSALAAVPADMREPTRASQRSWLRAVAIECQAGEPRAAEGLPGCMLQYYQERTSFLAHLVFKIAGVTFVWHSDSGAAPASKDADSPSPQPTIWTFAWSQALSDAPEWRAWNAAIEGLVKDPPGSQGGGEEVGTDTDVTVTVDFVSPQLASTSVSNLWYGHGAAHPNVDFIVFNWLLKENREIKSDDVFRPYTGWEQFLASQCDEAARAQLGEDYADNPPPGKIPDAMFGIVSNPRSWKIDSEGITIVFSTFEIGCHACTPNPVTIPWGALRTFLTPEFAGFAK
jgi:uncharacterized protein YecT (DUF1311 family)